MRGMGFSRPSSIIALLSTDPVSNTSWTPVIVFEPAKSLVDCCRKCGDLVLVTFQYDNMVRCYIGL